MKPSVIRALFVVMLLAALVARLWGLEAKSVWRDEADSVLFAGPPLAQILTNVDETNPPLYYALLHVCMRLFGNSEAALRALSVVCGVLAVAGVYWVGALLAGPALGLLAMALMTVMPMPVEFSQMARSYSLLLATGLASFGCLLQWERRPRGRWAAGYVAATVLMSYTHSYWVFTFLAQQGYMGWRALQRQVPVRTWGMVAAAALIGALPWMLVQAAQVRGMTHEGFWIPRPALSTLPGVLHAYVGGSPVWMATAALLAAFGAWRWPRAQAHDGRVLLLLAISCPIALPFLWSRIGAPIFWPRYTILAAPALYLLLARGVLALPRPSGRWAIGAGVLGFALLQLFSYYHQQWEDWRSAARTVERLAQAGDIVGVPDGASARAFAYYYQGAVPYQVMPSMINAASDEAAIHAVLQEAHQPGARLWLVVHEQPEAPRLITGLLAEEYPHAVQTHRQPIEGRLAVYGYRLPSGALR
jgi:uncharacterized membrane protein